MTEQARAGTQRSERRLEREAASRGTRFLPHLVVAVVGVDCVLASWLLAHAHPGPLASAGVDAASALGPLLVLLVTLGRNRASWRAILARPGARSALLLRMAVLSFGIGQILRVWYEVIQHRVPFPSLADGAYLTAAICLILGILLLLDYPLSLGLSARGFVDSMIVGAAVLTVNWYFVLGPATARENGPHSSQMLIGAYPATDLAVIFGLLLLWSQPLERVRKRVAVGLSIAAGIRVMVHFTYAYQVVHAVPALGGLASTGRSLCYLAVALVACVARRAGEVSSGSHKKENSPLISQSALGSGQAIPVWRALIPYVLTGAVGALVIYARTVPTNSPYNSGVYLGAGIMGALVLIHQVLGFLDNARLWHRLGDAYHTLETNNQTLADTNVRLRALWESASTDPLTGLPNHRTLVETVNREVERGRRHMHPCAVLFVDLDHFKAVNDTYGHLVGDSVLREFSRIVRGALREIDTLGRWGGEEFAVILPETDGATGFAVAERIREEVGSHTFAVGGGVRLTCSIGIASYPDDAVERDALVDAADRAMYAAKGLGRNQTRSATDPAVVGRSMDTVRSKSREEAALSGTVEALTIMLERHDRELFTARDPVAGLAGHVALALNFDEGEARMVDLAAQLHDIGKVSVPDSFLLKCAPLADEEWTVMHLHPVAGADVVSRVPALRGLAPMIRSHHERWDGAGYPDQLRTEDIPLGARIVAVVDAYRAMTAERPFQRARSQAEALHELQRCASTQFDPAVVRAFEKVLTGERGMEMLEDRSEASPSVA